MNTFETVQKLIVDKFGVTKEDVTPQMTFDDLGADSLDVVEFVMEVEDQFGIEFEDDRIESLNNIQDAVAYIDELKGQ
ncbi:acyl carrier protein [Facklamia languida]|uniref:Acyl carrier protein n=1 Tax=Facklamia languida CCUG 37842 TaxID=883113 RepID=H3NGR2_9LACT|nr:acyl carrier protein [Facklamia languida]EHR38341.1 acyl carrier protein [Facklamia languida CCUG 37842]